MCYSNVRFTSARCANLWEHHHSRRCLSTVARSCSTNAAIINCMPLSKQRAGSGVHASRLMTCNAGNDPREKGNEIRRWASSYNACYEHSPADWKLDPLLHERALPSLSEYGPFTAVPSMDGPQTVFDIWPVPQDTLIRQSCLTRQTPPYI